MPNHIHGIVIIDTPHPVGAGPRACPNCGRPYSPGPSHGNGRPQGNGPPQGAAPTLSLPDVVHRFKTMATKRYTDGVKQSGWAPYPGKLWQGNYYERIIRNDDELNHIREYIANNPMKWEFDRENPAVSILETAAAQRDGQA